MKHSASFLDNSSLMLFNLCNRSNISSFGWETCVSHKGAVFLTLVLKYYRAKKKFPMMGQVFLYSSDQCGSGIGWQNLRKWEKTEVGQKHLK